MTSLPLAAFFEFQCSERESNSHGLPHTPLKRARLPVPPSELEKNHAISRAKPRDWAKPQDSLQLQARPWGSPQERQPVWRPATVGA